MKRRVAGRGPGARRALSRVGGALPRFVVVVLAAWTVLAPATIASAAVGAADGSGSATIRGALVLPGGAAAPSGITVTLLGIPTTGDVDTRTVVSGPGGTFEFTGLAGGPSWSYTVTAPYQGTVFSSDLVGVDGSASASSNVALFETTASTQDVRVSDWTVWVDLEGAGMAVQQDLTFANAGSAAYLGTEPVDGTPGNDRASVTLPLVEGAADLKFLGRFEVCCGAVAGSSWSHTRPLDPGKSKGTLRYEAPVSTQLTFPVRFATAAFALLVPDGSQVSSPQLVEQPTTSTDRGVTYRVYRSGPLPAGSTVSVTLTTSSSRSGWIVAGAAAALLALAVVVVVRRRAATSSAAGPKRPQSPTPARVSRPSARPTAAERPAPAPPRRAGGAPTRPDRRAGVEPASSVESPGVLADEIAMLDLAFERGVLPDEASYRRVREALVQRLVADLGDDPASLGR